MQHTRWEQARGEALARQAAREQRETAQAAAGIARRQGSGSRWLLAVAAALVILLALNNPTKEDVVAMLMGQAAKQIQRTSTGDQQLWQMAGATFGATMLERLMTRRNYGIASWFETTADGHRCAALGIAGQIIPLGRID